MMRAVEQPVLTPWRPWEAVPVALAALCASVLVAVGLAAAGAGTGTTPVMISALVLELSFVGFSVAWVGIRHRQGIGALGLRSTRATRDLATGAWFGALLFGVAAFAIVPVLVALWTAVTGNAPPSIDQPVVPVEPSAAQVALGAFVVVAGASLGEEVFFRGFLFGSLRARLGFGRSAVISAAAFAIFHVQPLLVVVMFFVGFGLAWLYERRGSLVAPIAAHAMFNVIGFTLILMERT
jgi:membrane protease YdiL (CAAX protease family)